MPITVRGGLPVIIERGVTQTLSFTLLSSGSSVTPSAGTITILNAEGTAIVSAAAMTLGAGVATYSLISTLIPATMEPEERWQITLTLTIASLTETVVKDAVLAIRALHPVVSDTDLTARHSDLLNLLPSTMTNWNTPIQMAYEIIGRRLLAKGRRPWLVMSPWSLYDCHLNLALALVFTDLETYTTGPGKYSELAKKYMAQYESAWGSLEFVYDAGNTGEVKDAKPSVAAITSIWLN